MRWFYSLLGDELEVDGAADLVELGQRISPKSLMFSRLRTLT